MELNDLSSFCFFILSHLKRVLKHSPWSVFCWVLYNLFVLTELLVEVLTLRLCCASWGQRDWTRHLTVQLLAAPVYRLSCNPQHPALQIVCGALSECYYRDAISVEWPVSRDTPGSGGSLSQFFIQFLGELSELSLDGYATLPAVSCMLGSHF